MSGARTALERALVEDPRRLVAEGEALLARRSGSRSLATFVKQAWSIIDQRPLVWTWYLEALCLHLEAVARGRIKRFLGNAPPRNGKSNVFAIIWPAWVWTWAPATKFIYLSYDDNLVKEHSIKCRQLIESHWYRDMYRPPWVLTPDRNTQNDFVNTAGGRRIASSMKSDVIGRGADIIAIDDPLSVKEATSAAMRDEARRAIIQAVSTRLDDPATGRAAMLMQRVNANDPSKWALDAKWEHFCTPMGFVEERRSITYHVVDGARSELWRDPRTVEGELLVPERFPADYLEAKKLELGLMGYAAQFQQAPVAHAEAGTYFPRGKFRFEDAAPVDVVARVRRWDLASTEGGGDWTVGVRLARMADGMFYVEDVVRGQWGPHMVRQTVKNTAELDGYDCAVIVPQDPGQAGKDQAHEYTVMLAGCSISTPRETGDKVVRAGPASAQVQAGNVVLVRGAWNEPFLQTLEAFPDPNVHDDDADALAGAITALTQKQKSAWQEWAESDDDMLFPY